MQRDHRQPSTTLHIYIATRQTRLGIEKRLESSNSRLGARHHNHEVMADPSYNISLYIYEIQITHFGLLHFLSLVITPVPQVSEHALQGSQSLQPPWTTFGGRRWSPVLNGLVQSTQPSFVCLHHCQCKHKYVSISIYIYLSIYLYIHIYILEKYPSCRRKP